MTPAARDTPHQRIADACEVIARHYGVPAPSSKRLDELLPFTLEAVAAILTELPPTRMQGRMRREQKA